MIINESKRDDLLLPCLNILKEKGINATLGQLKTYMLRKLTTEAGIRNLSLSSNYYLAGAVRYYFNGDLTINKDLDVFKTDNSVNDVWNTEICYKLNILINILRDAYIDTIGTSFLEPEDFGTLPIGKLLKKYNKKIVSAINKNPENNIDTTENDGLDRNNVVGNGYTFEILYNYKIATKYNSATEPGAWCITYGQQHFDSYVKRLGIHYVVFRKDGWENVKRKKGYDWSPDRPQDEYGCSLIALLQSNQTGEPVYITSRWNHGSYVDDSGCEADHAFTKQQFMEKTGVTDADLQRIFAIWKKDKHLYPNSDDDSIKINREDKIIGLRKIKFIQMRLNNGDSNVDVNILNVLNGRDTTEAKLTKDLCYCCIDSNNIRFYFLCNKGKINFDSVTTEKAEIKEKEDGYSVLDGYNNIIVLKYSHHIMLYNTRVNNFINLDGVTKFKCIPTIYKKINGFYEVKVGKQQSALLNISNNQPLKLPNGSIWINKVYSNAFYHPTIIGNSNLQSALIDGDGVIEIVYDESSDETYFYDIPKRRFIPDSEIPKKDGYITILNPDFVFPGYISYLFTTQRDKRYFWYGKTRGIVLTKDGEILNLDGVTEFHEIESLGQQFISYYPESEWAETENNNNYRTKSYVYDLNAHKHLINPIDGTKLRTSPSVYSYANSNESRMLFLSKYNYDVNGCFLFDKEKKCFYINPFNYPSKYTFNINSNGNVDGTCITFEIKENPRSMYLDNNDGYEEDYRVIDIGLPMPNEPYRLANAKTIKLKEDYNIYYEDNFTDNDFNSMVNEILKKLK